MKNTRLYAIVLLAALALLQARLAFAGCDTGGPTAVSSSAACCGEDRSNRALTTGASACAFDRCVQPYASDESPPVLVGSQLPVFAHAPPPSPLTPRLAQTALRLSLTPSDLPPTRLIYVLQRLLI